MFMNYMDYVDDDTMYMFTRGQAQRMNAALAGPRAPLLQSRGLVAVAAQRIDLGDGERGALGQWPQLRSLKRGQPVFDGVNWVDPAEG
jgi:hypothetical protein